MLKKKMLKAMLVGAFVSFLSFAASTGSVSATNMESVLPAGGFALSIEEGVCIDDIYVAEKNEESVTDDMLIALDNTNLVVSSDENALGTAIVLDEISPENEVSSNDVSSQDTVTGVIISNSQDEVIAEAEPIVLDAVIPAYVEKI